MPSAVFKSFDLIKSYVGARFNQVFGGLMRLIRTAKNPNRQNNPLT